jgi:hypothetical protein
MGIVCPVDLSDDKRKMQSVIHRNRAACTRVLAVLVCLCVARPALAAQGSNTLFYDYGAEAVLTERTDTRADDVLVVADQQPFWTFDLRSQYHSAARLTEPSLNVGMAPIGYSYTGSNFRLDRSSSGGSQFLNSCKLVGGFELGLLGVMMLLPKDVTKWEDDFVQDAVHNLGTAFSSPPVWDQDDWALNYVGHPYAGSLYYNAMREQGAGPFQSFWFSVFASTAWEYVIEGVAERPSIQDLWVTPVVGSLLGELFHQATLEMKKDGTSVPEKVLITIINPLSVIFHGYRYQIN